MVNVLDFSGTNVGQALGGLSTQAARPGFELAYNAMQNTMIERVNKKITEMQADSSVNKVDAFLRLQKNKLERLQPEVTSYARQVVATRQHVDELLNSLYSLEDLAGEGDAAAFNTKLDEVNQRVSQLPAVNGAMVGVFTDDGVSDLARDGLGLDSFTDTVSSTEQVLDAISRISNLLTIYTVRQEDASEMYDEVGQKLTAANLEIQAEQVADQASKYDEIKKEQEKAGTLLQMLSLAFEVQQGQNDGFSKQLLTGQQYAPGSILNIFG